MADISRIALSTVQVAWKNIAEDIAGGQTSSAAEDGRPFAEGLEQDLKNLVVAANVVIALNESASTRLRADLHSFIRGSLTANGCLGSPPHTHTHTTPYTHTMHTTNRQMGSACAAGRARSRGGRAECRRGALRSLLRVEEGPGYVTTDRNANQRTTDL